MANLSNTTVWGDLNVKNDIYIKGNLSIHAGNISSGLVCNNNLLAADFDTNGVSNKVSRADHSHVNVKRTLMGQNTFVGKDSYKQIALTTTMSDTNYVVNVTPTQNPGGALGEIFVEKATTYIRVYNSGTFTGNFDWMVIY